MATVYMSCFPCAIDFAESTMSRCRSIEPALAAKSTAHVPVASRASLPSNCSSRSNSNRVLDIDIDTAGEKQPSTRTELPTQLKDGAEALLFIWIRSPPASSIELVLLLSWRHLSSSRSAPPRPSPYASQDRDAGISAAARTRSRSIPCQFGTFRMRNTEFRLLISAVPPSSSPVKGGMQKQHTSSTHLELADTNSAREKIRLLLTVPGVAAVERVRVDRRMAACVEMVKTFCVPYDDGYDFRVPVICFKYVGFLGVLFVWQTIMHPVIQWEKATSQPPIGTSISSS
ncbi:hypothetical protein C8R45DRAFT_935062 [Mycena sanguinolenta]|nr:hypothetical protein C8R45DRAFT_935062 [Mycena sanguinolenta]